MRLNDRRNVLTHCDQRNRDVGAQITTDNAIETIVNYSTNHINTLTLKLIRLHGEYTENKEINKSILMSRQNYVFIRS